MSEQIRVLLVDDEESFSKPMSERLEKKGFVVVLANSGPEAIAKAKGCNGNFNVAVIDQVMGPPNGIETMQNLRQIYPAIESIILTAWADQLGHGLEAVDMGAFRYMSKTANVDELALNIELAARFHRERRRRLVFKAILEITSLMQSAIGTPELLVKILEGIKGLGYDRARLYLLNPERTLLLGMAEVGGSRKPIHQIHIPLDQDQYSQHLLREAQPSHFHKGQYPDLFAEDLEKVDLEEWIELPLIFEGGIIGKITVDNKINRRSLTDQDMEDLMVLATQAVAAIIRSSQVEKHQNTLKTLVQVGQKISEAKTQEELYDLIWQQAQLLLPGVGGLLVSEYDEPNQTVHFALYHFQGSRQRVPPRSNWNGITEFVLRSKEPLLLSDGDKPFRERHGIPPSFLPVAKCSSAIIVPMFIDGKIKGTINVMSYDPSVHYTVEHLEMFRAFSNQVAVGLKTVRQLRETSELKDAVAILANKRGGQATLRAIVVEARKLIESDFTGLILQDESGVLYKSESVHPPDYNDSFAEPRQQGGITRTVVESRQPMIIPDTQQEPLVKPEVLQVGIRSMLAMPLIYGDRVLGVLFAHDFDTRYYSPHDINLWIAFAAQAAAALHTAFAEELRNEDTQRLLDGLTILVGRWNLQEAMTRVATVAKSIFCADTCRLAYVDPPTGQISDWAWADGDQEEYHYESEPRENGVTRHVLQTKMPLFRSDVDSQAQPFPPLALLERGLKSFASLPLIQNGRVIAVLHCNYLQRRQPFDDRYKTLFEAFCYGLN
jgi:GAF domain-containing protein